MVSRHSIAVDAQAIAAATSRSFRCAEEAFVSNTHIRLPSGVEAGLVSLGDPVANRLVVLCHPTPGAADFDPDPVVTSRWGVHIVALDRPGYAASPPLEHDRSAGLAARAADVGEFVQHLESSADRISHAQLTRFGVVGWGTGGVLAAAIAAADPGRVDRLALVNTPRPERAGEVARAALAAGPGITSLGITDDDADLPRRLGLLRRVERMLDAAFRQGEAGGRADLAMFEDAAVDPGRITAETRLWLGTRDPSVTEADVEWWGARIEGAKAQRVRDSGPLAIATAWERVLAHVAPEHGRIAEGERDSGDVFLADVDPVHPDRA